MVSNHPCQLRNLDNININEKCDRSRTTLKNKSNSRISLQMQPKKEREYLVAICVSLTTFTLYVKTLHPSLPGGDSGELVVAAHELGVSHPPGYPLFTLLSVLALHLVPVGSPVWRVNLLSAFLGASTSGVVYLLIYRLTKSLGAGCLGVAMFSLSRLVWVWSCVAEVFSLNNLMLALLMLTAVHFDTLEERTMKQMAYIGAFLCGLCLSNQHTSVLYIVFLVPWVMFRLWNAKLLSFALLVKLTLLFMLGLSPYLYLPVSSAVNKARWTWGDQSSLNGFLRHLLRQEYGTWDLLKDHRGQGFVSGILSYSSHVARDLSVPVSVLAVLSLWSTSYRYKVSKSSVLAVFTGMLMAYITFFCWRANLDIGNPLFFKVVERFWIQSDLVLSVLAAVSFDDFCRFISHRFRALSWYHLDILLMMPLFAWQLHSSWPVCDNSTNTVVQDFVRQTLAVFPNNSIILTKGDLPSNSFRYFHLCEGMRPDMTIFDQEVLTYQWSLPMTRKFYPGIKFPGDFLHLKSGLDKNGWRYFTFKDLIDANYHKAIFVCIGVQNHEPSWRENYNLLPYSMCRQMVKKGERLDVEKWSEITSHLADQWTYAWNRFEVGSWEQVANEEMWQAKTAPAMFYLDLALTLPDDSDEYYELLFHSYTVLSSAMRKAANIGLDNSSDDVPAYWHRNYAIVCERLLRQPSPVHTRPASSIPDQLTLVKLTVHHFKQFLRLDPHDPDSSRIQQAVKTFQKYLETVGT